MTERQPPRRAYPVVLRNLTWGSLWGLFLGGLYSLAGSAVYVLKGSSAADPGGVSLADIVSTYLLGGMAGGAIVGLLRPLTRWRTGAAVVGVVALTPVCMGFLYLMSGPIRNWAGAEIFALFVTAVPVGSYGGYQMWEPTRSSS